MTAQSRGSPQTRIIDALDGTKGIVRVMLDFDNQNGGRVAHLPEVLSTKKTRPECCYARRVVHGEKHRFLHLCLRGFFGPCSAATNETQHQRTSLRYFGR